jgi:3-phenylpropionate/cinnamic acid dioxygenase small subunit
MSEQVLELPRPPRALARAREKGESMATGERLELTTELRLDVEEFYFRYAECLDGGRLNQWPEFFLDACVYRVTTRRSLRLGPDEDLMSLKTKTAMRDRIVAIGQSEDYEPHMQRHFIANFRIQVSGEDELRVQANVQILRTYPDRATEFLASGYCLDRVAVTDGRLNFREKLCVFDSDIAPADVVYPV